MELGTALADSCYIRENSACSYLTGQAPKKSTTSYIGWDDVAAGSAVMLQLCQVLFCIYYLDRSLFSLELGSRGYKAFVEEEWGVRTDG